MSIFVQFQFRIGFAARDVANVRLWGSWDADGRSSSEWGSVTMQSGMDERGLEVFHAQISFPDIEVGSTFRWGIELDRPGSPRIWAIAAEVDDEASQRRERLFVLQPETAMQIYNLTWRGLLGANRIPAADGPDRIRFSVWAPNAQAVSLVLADPDIGYVADDGTGAVRAIPMHRADDGIWSVQTNDDAALLDFDTMVGTPYMYYVTKDDGSRAYRTDLWSLLIRHGDISTRHICSAGR